MEMKVLRSMYDPDGQMLRRQVVKSRMQSDIEKVWFLQ